MKVASIAVLSALVLMGCGPDRGRDSGALLDAYGLQATTNGTADTDAAIRIANALLAKGSPRLQGVWSARTFDPAAVIPVYLVGDRNLTPADLAFVTPFCEAIALQNPPFQAWVRSLSDSDGPQVEPAAMTAFVLLHELGHLKSHDCGRKFVADNHGALNDQTNADKAQEFAADGVAVAAVRTATQYGSLDAKVAAGRVEMALATASFYVAGRRIVASPGAVLLGSPAVFWDIGFTHPNFEWRLLKVNDLLNSSEVTQKLLADFEAGRAQGEQPLYVAPSKP